MNKDQVHKLVHRDELLQDLFVQFPMIADEGSDLLLGQPALAVQERSHFLGIGAVQESGFIQDFQTFLRIEVELLDTNEELLVSETLSAVI